MGVEHGRDAVAAVDAVRQLLGSSNSMKVIHPGGHLWDAHFSFAAGASTTEIQAVEASLGFSLPESYKRFLYQYNGCVLYKDEEYGQWGVQVYGTRDLASENVRLRDENGEYWIANYLVFARMLGESDVLVMEMGKPARDGEDNVVLDGDAELVPKHWPVAAQDFGIFIDHLVCAQGARYWRWR